MAEKTRSCNGSKGKAKPRRGKIKTAALLGDKTQTIKKTASSPKEENRKAPASLFAVVTGH
jgi:hypothetical protein